MTTFSNANLLIAAQLYSGSAPSSKAKRAAAAVDFTVELEPRAKDKPLRHANPTMSPPQAPQPMAPAKRFDEGAGRKDQMPAPQQQAAQQQPQAARFTRPGSQLNILV